ncbi:hypothetical protein B8W69_03565 [Mycobacterium vulneris]|uniref:Metallo-beta-lactamase domain-containing protein n=1 Tax=Mycolicibacterium vulneris TaxID=547163 RepID=A0A1X2LC64_9MYCO|nr:hypothetical protein B8W69_03565 [Mycolicibacterium vulneris]
MVMHVGREQWAIVDSLFHYGIDGSADEDWTDMPAARWYLDNMQVRPERVRDIYLTHFHKDHFEGVGLLHGYYMDAQLLVTAPLGVSLFQSLFSSDRGEPTVFGEVPDTLNRALERKRARFLDGLRTLQVGWSRPYADDVRLTALSPLDAAIRESQVAIADCVGKGWPAVRTELRRQNSCSVVLHLETPAGHALLGADLENTPANCGWAAVLAERDHGHLKPADLVKIPHHGSAGADHEPMWGALTQEPRELAVTPFETGSVRLPTHADWVRLCKRGQLHQAAPTSAPWMNEFGFTVSNPRLTGVVRARRRAGEAQWRISRFGSAFNVNSVLATAPLTS